jgi:spoIIIJ-associated protein
MRSVETEGATIDEAIARALELLRADRSEVEIDIVENSTRGMLGFGTKRARIRATVRAKLTVGDDGVRDAGASVSRESGAVPAPEDGLTVARGALEVVLAALQDASTVSLSEPEENVWMLSVAGSGTGLVIGRHGQTLDAIEYLLNRILAQQGVISRRILLDVEGYRARRQESLEETARRLAARVRESGSPAALSPMSARDRRIVHLTLNDDRDVSTLSEGEGAYRRVVIVPRRASSPPSTTRGR